MNQKRMLVDTDSGLNLALGFDESLENVLTRTMLNQEEIFRNQVLELHRLYGIQKMLMNEDSKLSCREGQHSFGGAFTKKLKYESLATVMKSSEVHMICSSGSVENQSLKEHRGTFEHQQISLDLNLAGSQYTKDNENILCDCFTPKASASTKHGIYNDKVSSTNVLQLYLRASADTLHKGSGKNTCKDKIMCLPLLLARQVGRSTDDGDQITVPACGYATHATHSGARNMLETSCTFRSRKNDSFEWIPQSQTLRDGRLNLQERNHFYQGVEECHGELSCKNMSARRKLFASYEVEELDLNKALPDESSVHPSHPWLFSPSQCTSSDVSHKNEVGDNGKDNIFSVLDPRQPKNNFSTEPSALAGQDITVSTLTISPSRDAGEHICKSKFCSVDFGSVCGHLSVSKDHVSSSGNLRPWNAESEMHLPDKTCRRISMPELNFKKKEGKLCSHYSSQELLEGTDSNRSPVSCKSDWIADDVSSNTKAGQCLIDTPNSNVSPSILKNSESSLLGKKTVKQTVMPSSEMKSQSSDPEKEELAEVDVSVRKGAVSLIYFSLDCLARSQDYAPESRKREESCNVEREVPQTSSESYESIVLKQQESIVGEFCVSSMPLEVTGLDTKNHGVKLKRGRRMKDFRKEILPGLASLSRKEISEDISIMELALRSREYKKYRYKTAGRSDCISPVRSRRSRLCYVGKR